MSDIASVGKHTYGTNCITCKEWGEGSKLHIGAFCSIADCTIFLGGNHRVERITTFPFGHAAKDAFRGHDGRGHPGTRGDVVIGNDVWIAHGATIMSGVKIGDGAVVAANAHVVKDVEPYSIVGGNPARHIRYRFEQDVRDKLLKIKWWEWEDEKINANLHLLCDENKIQEFLKI